ncbi:formin-like protein 20 isoform X2 [Denticeps clupeoides]|uniref:formin-like protein 20 isoform X2 n=1 Tax=Denticeps clupeoides TaxID=299321 RepID=UPI0010A50366|nr:formin-like protein 20 isoform X2 [Denticeps clupeoides]
MDVATEQAEELAETPAASTEETATENKGRLESQPSRDRGMKGHARGGRMGRGGRGGRGLMKGYGPPDHGRCRGRGRVMNGFGPMRRGMGRMRPYPDIRGRQGGRGCHMGMGPPPPPPPPMHLRGPYPPLHRHPPPPPLGHPGFRGRPPHPRGMSPGPPRHFHPRGYHNGPAPPPPHPPLGRGQQWPGPPGGRRF